MYSYTNNHPIKYIDPNGHWLLTGLIIGAVFVVNTIIQESRSEKEIEKVQKKYPNYCPNVLQSLNFAQTLQTNASTVKQDTKNMNEVDKLSYLIEKTGSGKAYDLKNGEWNRDIYYNGMILEPQDIGNYNFGYIGRAMGYDMNFLTTGAGIYQLKEHWRNPVTYVNCLTFSICDDPRDTYYIRLGAIAYDNEH